MALGTAAPILLILALLLVAAGVLFVSSGRLDLRRSVRVHVPLAFVWSAVRHVPTLHGRHGRALKDGGIDDWILRRGDGESAGSIWRGHGRWGGLPYWVDVEIVRSKPGRDLAITLTRDSLGTQRRLRGHLGELILEEVAPGTTKVTWRLRARLRGARMRAERLLSLPRLQARLLDHGLRSLKVGIEREFALEADAALREDPARGAGPRSPDLAATLTIDRPAAPPPRPPRQPDESS